MKKLILPIAVCLLDIACTKSKNNSSNSTYGKSTSDTSLNGVSAVHGCVYCITTIDVNGIATGWSPTDTMLCNTSDSILSSYIYYGNYTYPKNAGEIRTTHTTCTPK